MSDLSWKDIENGLRQQSKPASARDADSFWAEFRARAELQGQDGGGLQLVEPRPWRRFAAAAAALVVLLGIGYLVMNREVEPVGAAKSPMAMITNQIKSLEVRGNHTAVSVMQGDENTGTVVWIAGLEDNSALEVNP